MCFKWLVDKASFFIALLFISQMFHDIASQHCGAGGDLYSIYHMMLRGHTYKTFNFTPGTLECSEACLADDICQSYNVVMVISICELNRRTKEDRPEDFVKDKDRYYMAKSLTRVCEPVGVADRSRIPDARMTASSFYDSLYHPYYGRMNESRGDGGWCTRTQTDRTDYLQIDMGAVRSVCAVATQGFKNANAWTTSYKLQLSSDGTTWTTYKETNVEKIFQGNTDLSSIVKNPLSTDVRYVRFYPVTYQRHPCLRVEVFVLN